MKRREGRILRTLGFGHWMKEEMLFKYVTLILLLFTDIQHKRNEESLVVLEPRMSHPFPPVIRIFFVLLIFSNDDGILLGYS